MVYQLDMKCWWSQQSSSWIPVILHFIKICKIICPFLPKNAQNKICRGRQCRQAYIKKNCYSLVSFTYRKRDILCKNSFLSINSFLQSINWSSLVIFLGFSKKAEIQRGEMSISDSCNRHSKIGLESMFLGPKLSPLNNLKYIHTHIHTYTHIYIYYL